MDESTYHLGQNGQNTGPFTLTQVRDLWASGAVSAGTLYWQPGMPEWQPLAQIAVTLGAAGSPPALSPPPVPQAGADYLTRTVPTAQQTTSGLAITSFVLGLASLLFSLLTALPAIICGHIALSQIKNSHGRLVGRGFAITGLIFGYAFGLLVAIVMVGVLAGIALPVFNSVSIRGKETRELAQAKQVALAIKLYEGDNDGKTPPNLDALSPTYLSDKSFLVSRLSEGESPAVELVIPNTKADDVDPQAVLLRGRFTGPDHKRVYIYNDLHGELKRDP